MYQRLTQNNIGFFVDGSIEGLWKADGLIPLHSSTIKWNPSGLEIIHKVVLVVSGERHTIKRERDPP
jgi:hypothetical protein